MSSSELFFFGYASILGLSHIFCFTRTIFSKMWQPQRNTKRFSNSSEDYRNQFNSDKNPIIRQPYQTNNTQFRNNVQTPLKVLHSALNEIEIMDTSNNSTVRAITKSQYPKFSDSVNQKRTGEIAIFPEKHRFQSPQTALIDNNSKPVKKNDSKNVNGKFTVEDPKNTNFVLDQKPFMGSGREKMFIFTGTVERVLKWHKIFQNHTCIYEIIASVISIKNGSVTFQRTMLLRDRKGPILQVIYYSVGTHIDIQDFHIGQMLRCVGRMTGSSTLTAITIRTALKSEIDTLQRLCYVCDHAISHFTHS